MIELPPDEEQYEEKKPGNVADKSGSDPMRPLAKEDLRFFVKGSLSLFSKFIHDLDWFLTEINSRNKT